VPWRVSTSPRSLSVAIQRLKALVPFEGLDWNTKSEALSGFTERNGRQLRMQLTRREFVYAIREAEGDLPKLAEMGYPTVESFMAAGKDTADIEAVARMAMDVFREYGFAGVSTSGLVFITEAGRAVAEHDTPLELVMLQFCKANQRVGPGDAPVFPMRVLATALLIADSLRVEELGVITLCDEPTDVEMAGWPAIKAYRSEVLRVATSTKSRVHATLGDRYTLLADCCRHTFGPRLVIRRVETVFRDYPDAVARVLQFVGLGTWKGMGTNKKLWVAPGAREKLLLLKDQRIEIPEKWQNVSSDDPEYLKQWLGALNVTELPWAQPDALRIVIRGRIRDLSTSPGLPAAVKNTLATLDDAVTAARGGAELAVIESQLRGSTLPAVTEHYARVTSKSPEERQDILDLLARIQTGHQENGALWLEAGAWRALTSLDGAPMISHGCKFDEHLNPLSYAPGGPASPDMFSEYGTAVLVVEVTTLRNNEQWVREGASVIDHVQSFIKAHKGLPVIGVFVCPTVYYRTLWQFFMLARESWLGQPIPVVPLTIAQFRGVLVAAYEHGHTFHEVAAQITDLAAQAENCRTYEEWRSKLDTTFPAAVTSE